ncbi:MAG: hypothetical protein LBN34_04340 [Clostridiales Family XIII bacterium]|jgi:hypothetical protein|nr:hypothetical protein [Clostridiales Family XIII bacterium]
MADYKRLKTLQRPFREDRYEMAEEQLVLFQDGFKGITEEENAREVEKLIKKEYTKKEYSEIVSRISFITFDWCNIENTIDEYCGEKDDCHKHCYIWISIDKTGMVNTVGRATFISKNKPGDLFDNLKFEPNCMTARILLELKNDNKYKYVITAINNEISKHIKYAIIISLEKDTEVSEIETAVGKYLIGEGVPILDYYSHNW